jgi:pyruvate/2-oxoglutarate dehydrogenase complex dihydrolipoamide acyltransferase (E2) component
VVAAEGPSQTTILGAVAVVVAGGAAFAAAGKQGELPSSGDLQAGASQAADAAKGGCTPMQVHFVFLHTLRSILLCHAAYKRSKCIPLTPVNSPGCYLGADAASKAASKAESAAEKAPQSAEEAQEAAKRSASEAREWIKNWRDKQA